LKFFRPVVVLAAASALFLGCAKEAPKGEAKSPKPAAKKDVGAVKPATKKDAGAVKAKAVSVDVTKMKVIDFAALKAMVEKRGSKLTMVPFWATWCSPCIKEMPHLAKFYQAHKDQGLDIIAVCVGDKGDEDEREQMQEVLDDLKSPFQHFLVKPDDASAFFKAFGQEYGDMLPATVLLDSKGAPVDFTRNGWTDDSLSKIILPKLK
jgi:thiol-disulfide isomerase/thioredoxin